MSRVKNSGGTKRLAKGVAAAGVGVAILAANKEVGLFNFFGFGTHQNIEIPEPHVKVTKITPIDLGCFVVVESDVELAAHVHNVVDTPLGSKTYSTDTTKVQYHGDADICVDNKQTEITRLDDPKTNTSSLLVTIGGLVVDRPRINHDGQDAPDYNPSLGTRVSGVLGGGENGNVVAGLESTAQYLIGTKGGCVSEAVTLAQQQVVQHYDSLAQQIGGIPAGNVKVSYMSPLPQGQSAPTGVINTELNSAGILVPQDWEIEAGDIACATTINGQPIVADQSRTGN